MKIRRASFAIIAVIIVMLISGVEGEGKVYSLFDKIGLSEATIGRLLSKGQLLMVKETASGKLELVSGGILINKPVKRVYKVITDYKHYHDFIPSTKKVEVLYSSPDGKVKHVLFVIKFKFSIISYSIKYKLKMRYTPPKKIVWDLIEGDMKATYGSWVLIPLSNNRTAAFYSVYSDTRSINWVVRKFIDSTPGMDIAINASACMLLLKSVKARSEKGDTYKLKK